MMQRKVIKISLLFLFMLNLVSCKKQDETVNPDQHSYIQGVVTIEGHAVAGAFIQLDNNYKSVTMTNSYGQFQMYNVTTGEHSLVIQKDLDNGSSIYFTLVRSVTNQSVDLGEIRFSKTPTIYLDTVYNQSTIKVKWDKTSDKDFKEYVVYRSGNSELTDASGAIVYRSSNISDTSFTDNSLSKGATAYYRVYVYSNIGKTYGSTIEGVNAPPKNYITNGSFETVGFGGNRPNNWTYNNQGVLSYDYMQLSSKNVKDGKLSLEISWTDSIAKYSHQATLYQTIQTNQLVPGKTYRFSFWAKSDTGQIGVYFYLADKMNYLSIPGKQDWTEKSITFQMDQSIQSMRVEIISSGDFSRLVKGWLDNVSLVEVR